MIVERGIAGRVAAAFVHSKLTPLFMAGSLLLGLFAVLALPREEEPQIVVPMIDVFAAMPGATSVEVEQRLTRPLEKLLWEIPGVEYLYSTSAPGQAMVVVRFLVGQNEEDALVRLNQKLASHSEAVPPGAGAPVVKLRSIDDVPVMAITLWGELYDDYQLRQIAGQLHETLKEIPDVSDVTITGGRSRQVTVQIDPVRLAAYRIDPLMVREALHGSNARTSGGEIVSGNRGTLVQAGTWIESAEAAGDVVVATRGAPILVRDVATMTDAGGEPDSYVTFAARDGRVFPRSPSASQSGGARMRSSSLIESRKRSARFAAGSCRTTSG